MSEFGANADSGNPYETPADVGEMASGAADSQPTLYRDKSFWGMAATQFFGAFNDNLFKQLILLMVLTLAAAAAEQEASKLAFAAADQEATQKSFQSVALFVFALPFLLCSGYAGYLSDRYSKRRIIVLSKVAEIVVMSLGIWAFSLVAQYGTTPIMVVLFLMGLQSTFFGPGKYGILPEMLRDEDLPRANGFIMMTTFMAIIFGIVAAGLMKDYLGDENLWLASTVCVVIAGIGTVTSLLVRKVPVAAPDLKFQVDALWLPKPMRVLLWQDRPLLWALLASSMFWLVGGIVLPAVNELGKKTFSLTDTNASLLAACIALGIAMGCVAAGWLSRKRVNPWVSRVGAWGIVVCLLLLAMPGSKQGNLLGPIGCTPVLLLLGVATGMFVVPIQVFLQSRSPVEDKGRMIAAMNFANWVAILAAAVIYFGVEKCLLPPRITFGLTALLMAPVAVFYSPPGNSESVATD